MRETERERKRERQTDRERETERERENSKEERRKSLFRTELQIRWDFIDNSKILFLIFQ